MDEVIQPSDSEESLYDLNINFGNDNSLSITSSPSSPTPFENEDQNEEPNANRQMELDVHDNGNTSSESDDNSSFGALSESDNELEPDAQIGNNVTDIDLERDPSNPYGLTEQDIVNYPDDTEHEMDFELGWVWSFQPDRGASYGPFLSKNILFLDPRTRDPENFLNFLFTEEMWQHITAATNSYAEKHMQQQGTFHSNFYLFKRIATQ